MPCSYLIRKNPSFFMYVISVQLFQFSLVIHCYFLYWQDVRHWTKEHSVWLSIYHTHFKLVHPSYSGIPSSVTYLCIDHWNPRRKFQRQVSPNCLSCHFSSPADWLIRTGMVKKFTVILAVLTNRENIGLLYRPISNIVIAKFKFDKLRPFDLLSS